MSNLDMFSNRKTMLQKKEVELKNSHSLLGTLRLLCFLAIAFFVFITFKKGLSLSYMLASFILLCIFVFVLIKDIKVSNNIKTLKNLISINEDYINRITGNFNSFKDCGDDFLEATHPYEKDLDIFGQNSLFQLINVAKTFIGRNKLAKLLKAQELKVDVIRDRQAAVSELASNIEFCQNLQCAGANKKHISEDPKNVLEYIETKNNLSSNSAIRLLIYILPIITIAFAVLTSIFKIHVLAYILIALLFIHIAINVLSFLTVYPTLNDLENFNSNFDVYSSIIAVIENETFNCKLLTKLHQCFFNKGKASSVLKKLDTIISAVNLRSNFLLYFILNLIFFWDFHCLFFLEAWKDKYGDNIRTYLNTAGDFEMLASLAVVSHFDCKLCTPTFSLDTSKIIAEELGHPLINNSSRVYNNINFDNNIFIVTGSNMSGKTTFLRTIGINLVLAYSGASVLADSFHCSLLKIFTSMRISDDLSQGLSTFYVELTRIKTILDFLPRKEPMLFLIDEIFRGTNSNDRIIGAKTVLKNLNTPWCCGLISTHDFELCDLENLDSKKILNYHFKEDYIDEKIHFDYKLIKGRSDTTNAKFLMRMIGIEIN